MALPFWMITELKITVSQKLGLAFIFSFAFVCIALDIVRVVEAVSQNQALYTVIEVNLVVVISCLPTYRTLLIIRKQHLSRQTHPWRSLEQGNYWKSQGSSDMNTKSTNIEMNADVSHMTPSLEVPIVSRDMDLPKTLDTTSKPARATSTSGVRTQAVMYS